MREPPRTQLVNETETFCSGILDEGIFAVWKVELGAKGWDFEGVKQFLPSLRDLGCC